MGEYRLNSCLYTNASYYIDEFTSYIKQFEKSLQYEESGLLTHEHFISAFNYWINIINSPYVHVIKPDRFIFHSLSYTLQNIIKHHQLTISLKEQFPNNNLCIFFYSIAISLELQKSLIKILPEDSIKKYYLHLKKPSFFDQTDEDLNKEYNRKTVMLKKQAFYQLHTNIRLHDELTNMLQKCTFSAKECISKHTNPHFNNYLS